MAVGVSTRRDTTVPLVCAVFMLDVPDVSVISDDFSGYVPNPAYSDVVWFYELNSEG